MIDLSQLPKPDIVETLDFEKIYQDMLATLLDLMGDSWNAPLESDPVIKVIELAAYREVQIRAQINDAARAVMLAFSVGNDLEHLAANVGITRLVITPGDPTSKPPTDPVYESDSSLRMRIQMAWEGLSVAGPRSAYVYLALSADGRVADALAVSPKPAEVVVTILSSENGGVASKELLDIVEIALCGEYVRPVADRVTVVGATIIPYKIKAGLWLYPGPEIELVIDAAREQVQEYATKLRRLGREVNRSAIYAALHVDGVQKVDLEEPATDVLITAGQASDCIEIDITYSGSTDYPCVPDEQQATTS